MVHKFPTMTALKQNLLCWNWKYRDDACINDLYIQNKSLTEYKAERFISVVLQKQTVQAERCINKFLHLDMISIAKTLSEYQETQN